MSIPEDHKTAIITNGLHFMRSITEAYGADKGMELWDTITSALDPDIKGQIFFAMITGTYNDRVHLKGLGSLAVTNDVSCIKEIRTWSGLGLKESKDIYDRLRNRTFDSSPSQEFVKVKHEEYHKAVAGLRNVGFVV
jgi:hypothetical protein